MELKQSSVHLERREPPEALWGGGGDGVKRRDWEK